MPTLQCILRHTGPKNSPSHASTSVLRRFCTLACMFFRLSKPERAGLCLPMPALYYPSIIRGRSRIQERGVPKCARISAQKFFQVPHPLLDTPTKYTIMKFCSAADVCVPKTMDISSYWISFDGYIKNLVFIIYLFYPLLTLKPFALPWAPHESVFSSTCLIL